MSKVDLDVEVVNILIVDDQPANLLALETILKCPELRIVKATSGNEALAQLLEMDFACIVLDVNMPEMDGFELGNIIRLDSRTKHVPIIFASGQQQAQKDIFKGYETGAVDYLLKPLNATIVRSKIQVFAELYRGGLALTKKAEELRRSNAELDQYAAIAAHDLSAPLRRVNSCAQILEKEFQGKWGFEADQLLKTMTANTDRMRVLIDDLLAYAKVGRKPVNERLELKKIVQEALADLSLVIEETGAMVLCDDLPVITASPVEMRQLMHNLLGNALKYRRKGVPPEIRVTAVKQGSRWVIKVIDNGIGIDRKDQDKLFIIFSRIHSESEYPGTGIGLAICRKVIEGYGGKIWIESEAERGSTFHFTFPITDLPEKII